MEQIEEYLQEWEPALEVERMTVFSVEITDEIGSLSNFLQDAAGDSIDLQCLTAISTDKGLGTVLISSEEPASLELWLKDSGIMLERKAGFKINGEDVIGAAADILAWISSSVINIEAACGLSSGWQYHMLIVVSELDGNAVEAILNE